MIFRLGMTILIVSVASLYFPLNRKLTDGFNLIYEQNSKFGWNSEKPFSAQVTFLLESDQDSTTLTWTVESSEEAGILQLAEPLLLKQTDEMIRKSLVRLKEYLQTRKL